MNLQKIIQTIARLNKIRRLRPHIYISRYGQLTDNPGVDVSIHSRGGLIGVYDFPYNDPSELAAEARATLAADDLSHITGLPIVDERPDVKQG